MQPAQQKESNFYIIQLMFMIYVAMLSGGPAAMMLYAFSNQLFAGVRYFVQIFRK